MKSWRLALGLLTLVAGTAMGAFIVFPKVWSPGCTLDCPDLAAIQNAITGQMNGNVTDINVATNAAIKGSKIAAAPNGVPTAQLNDLSVTIPKLAVGAAVNGVASVQFITQAIVNAELSAGQTPTLATRGGKVLVTGTSGYVKLSAADGTVDVMLYRCIPACTLLNTWTFGLTTTGSNVMLPVPTPTWIDTPPVGNVSYKITMKTSGASVQVGYSALIGLNPGFLFAMELS